MAIVYYPSSATVYTRYVSGGQMVSQYIGVAPDQIVVLSGSTMGTVQDFITASYANTASIALNAVGGGGSDYIGNQVFS